MARIELDNLSLTFQVRPTDGNLLKGLVKACMRRPAPPMQEVHALRDVNLSIAEGQRVAIVGRNGAGKSTLLKVMADIYPPTRGRRVVSGKISSLFDITLGFEVHATGWENIRYRGYLQGETPWSVRAKMKSVADFSELGRFLDMPLRYYSAGMCVRLAFSIATAINPEVLLIDEAFGAGDTGFQEKARLRIEELMAKARIVVAINHDLTSLLGFCNRAIWLDQGAVRQIGPAAEVIAAYRQSLALPTPLAA